jgi:hypothetical protein
MNDSLMNIIFMLVAAAVGYAVGLLDRRVTAAAKQKKQEKEEILSNEKASALLAKEQARLEQVAKELAAREQAIGELIVKKEADARNEHTALQVLVDPVQNWLVEVDGQRIPAGELTADQRQRLLNIVVQIRPWIDGKLAPKVSPTPAPVDSPLPAPQPRTPESRLASSVAPTGPRIDPIRGFRSMVENDVKKKEVPHLVSVVSLIDDVLQRQLENSPLANRGIKLEEGPHGEVLVHVGNLRYSGIDEVPQPEIQAAIKNAIAEFNKG